MAGGVGWCVIYAVATNFFTVRDNNFNWPHRNSLEFMIFNWIMI